MTRWLVACSLFTLALPGAVQAKCMVGDVADLKVTMVGSQPMVDVGINGHQTRFMADSGAFYSVIPTGSARELGLPLTPLYNFTVHGVGGEQSASVATVKDLTLAGLTLHNIQFIVSGSEIGAAAGVIGQNVLGFADVEYDLEHGMIRLMKPKGCGSMNFAYWAGTQPISMIETEARDAHQTHTIGKVLVNGVAMRAMFDTGASTSALSLAAAARLGIKPGGPGVVPAGYSHGVGRHTVQTWIAPFDDIKIGGEEIRRTKLRIGDLGLENTDMLIGADFFVSHRIYVANSDRKMYFTYDGGPVFNIKPDHAVDGAGIALALPTDTAEPKDAGAYSQRGTAFAARHELAKADDDLSHAITLAPTEARYYYERAQIRLAEHQPSAAREDLDQAITLAPTDPQAHIFRARARLAAHDRGAAREDIEAADHALAPAGDLRLELGVLYTDIDDFDHAVAQYDQWLRTHPDDSRRTSALNSRCWARGLGGRELLAALNDCNAAIRQSRDNPSFLDSRALVHLRMGDYAAAVTDYSAALAINPKLAMSLYGRSVAERHLQQAKAADTDAAAALAITPHLDERFKTLGIS